jgi:hypothetical protein
MHAANQLFFIRSIYKNSLAHKLSKQQFNMNSIIERIHSVDVRPIVKRVKHIGNDLIGEIKHRAPKQVPPLAGDSVHAALRVMVVLFALGLSFIAPPLVAFLSALFAVRQNNKDLKHSIYIVASTVAIDIGLCWLFWIPAVLYSLILLLQVTQYIPFWESTENFGTILFSSIDEKKKE